MEGVENTSQEYVKKQGAEQDYKRIHRQQLVLFWYFFAFVAR
jgi:hypothetical protein